MKINNKKKTIRMEHWISIFIIFFSVIIFVLIFFLIKQYVILRKADVVNVREIELSSLVKGHQKPDISDADLIRSWMTFDYINKLFNLPNNYFQINLSINNKKYPQMVISDYAEDNNLDQKLLLQDIVGLVKKYLIKN